MKCRGIKWRRLGPRILPWQPQRLFGNYYQYRAWLMTVQDWWQTGERHKLILDVLCDHCRISIEDICCWKLGRPLSLTCDSNGILCSVSSKGIFLRAARRQVSSMTSYFGFLKLSHLLIVSKVAPVLIQTALISLVRYAPFRCGSNYPEGEFWSFCHILVLASSIEHIQIKSNNHLEILFVVIVFTVFARRPRSTYSPHTQSSFYQFSNPQHNCCLVNTWHFAWRICAKFRKFPCISWR